MNKKDKLRQDLKIAANMLDRMGYVDDATVLDSMSFSLKKTAQDMQQQPMMDMGSMIANSAQGAVGNAVSPVEDAEAVETADIGLEAAPASEASDEDINDMMVELSGVLGEGKLKLQKKLAEKGLAVDYSSVVTLFNKAEQQIISGIVALLQGEQIGSGKNKQRKQMMGQGQQSGMDMGMGQQGGQMDMNGGQQGNNFFANAGEQQQ